MCQFPACFKHGETALSIHNPLIDGGRDERTARFRFVERVRWLEQRGREAAVPRGPVQQ